MPSSFAEWVEQARSLGERKFVARFVGFYLLSTEDNVELQTMLQTKVTEAPNPRRRLASRNFEIRNVIKAAENDEPISVGRSRTCDIVFKHPSVSKVHAHLRPAGSGLSVVDLKSRNGTSVNGMAIAAEKPTPVDCQDRIQFGSVQTMVLDAGDLFDLVSRMG